MSEDLSLPQQELARLGAAIVAEDARRSGSRSFSAFVKQAWPTCDTSPLVWGMHLDALCLHLEAVAREELRRLVANLPPRHGKSVVFAVLWPAWVWTWRPSAKFIFLSYSDDLVVEHSTKCRAVVESEWYRRTYGPGWNLLAYQNTKHDFASTAGGRRIATSIKAGVTGRGADYLAVDDPLSTEEAPSRAAREEARRVISQAASTRLDDPERGCVAMVMQRVHAEDPSAWAISAGYEHLCLPSEFVASARSVTHKVVERRNGHVSRERAELWRDPRQQDGDLLFPERFTAEVLLSVRRGLGTAAYAAQHQQRPISGSAGALWRPEHIDRARVTSAPAMSRLVVAVDPSGSAKRTADEAGIVVAGAAPCACRGVPEVHGFVFEDLSGRYSPNDMGRKAVDGYHRWRCDRLVAEDNFGGELVRDLIALVDASVAYRRVYASRGKVARAEPVAALYEAGRVHHVGIFPLLEEQLCSYAGGGESPGRLDALVWALSDLMIGDAPAAFGDVPFKAQGFTFGAPVEDDLDSEGPGGP